VPLYVTSRGLTTSLIPYGRSRGFQIDFDFERHQLDIVTTDDVRRSIPLEARPVADFYCEVMGQLDHLGLHTRIWPMPVEIEGAIRFDQDREHATYDPDHAHRFWQLLVHADRVFHEFRSRFVGKASPVHLFWGGLDLAVTRFSGRQAPPYSRGVPNCGPQVMLEAYSHEVSSCGYARRRRRGDLLLLRVSRARGLPRRARPSRRSLVQHGARRVRAPLRARPHLTRRRCDTARVSADVVRSHRGQRRLGPTATGATHRMKVRPVTYRRTGVGGLK
jgi:hypothetical protein